MARMARLVAAVLAGLCAAGSVPGCAAGTGVRVDQPDGSTSAAPPSSAARPSSPAPTAPAAAAVAAYLAGQYAYDTALADPRHADTGLPRYFAAPLLDEVLRYLRSAVRNGIVFRGPRPAYRPRAVQVTAARVVLLDCPLGYDRWAPVHVGTGRPVFPDWGRDLHAARTTAVRGPAGWHLSQSSVDGVAAC